MFYIILFGIFAVLATWNADPFLTWMEETMKWPGPLRATIAIVLLGLVPAIIIAAGGIASMFVSDGRRRS